MSKLNKRSKAKHRVAFNESKIINLFQISLQFKSILSNIYKLLVINIENSNKYIKIKRLKLIQLIFQ